MASKGKLFSNLEGRQLTAEEAKLFQELKPFFNGCPPLGGNSTDEIGMKIICDKNCNRGLIDTAINSWMTGTSDLMDLTVWESSVKKGAAKADKEKDLAASQARGAPSVRGRGGLGGSIAASGGRGGSSSARGGSGRPASAVGGLGGRDGAARRDGSARRESPRANSSHPAGESKEGDVETAVAVVAEVVVSAPLAHARANAEERPKTASKGQAGRKPEQAAAEPVAPKAVAPVKFSYVNAAKSGDENIKRKAEQAAAERAAEVERRAEAERVVQEAKEARAKQEQDAKASAAAAEAAMAAAQQNKGRGGGRRGQHAEAGHAAADAQPRKGGWAAMAAKPPTKVNKAPPAEADLMLPASLEGDAHDASRESVGEMGVEFHRYSAAQPAIDSLATSMGGMLGLGGGMPAGVAGLQSPLPHAHAAHTTVHAGNDIETALMGEAPAPSPPAAAPVVSAPVEHVHVRAVEAAPEPAPEPKQKADVESAAGTTAAPASRSRGDRGGSKRDKAGGGGSRVERDKAGGGGEGRRERPPATASPAEGPGSREATGAVEVKSIVPAPAPAPAPAVAVPTAVAAPLGAGPMDPTTMQAMINSAFAQMTQSMAFNPYMNAAMGMNPMAMANPALAMGGLGMNPMYAAMLAMGGGGGMGGMTGLQGMEGQVQGAFNAFGGQGAAAGGHGFDGVSSSALAGFPFGMNVPMSGMGGGAGAGMQQPVQAGMMGGMQPGAQGPGQQIGQGNFLPQSAGQQGQGAYHAGTDITQFGRGGGHGQGSQQAQQHVSQGGYSQQGQPLPAMAAQQMQASGAMQYGGHGQGFQGYGQQQAGFQQYQGNQAGMQQGGQQVAGANFAYPTQLGQSMQGGQALNPAQFSFGGQGPALGGFDQSMNNYSQGIQGGMPLPGASAGQGMDMSWMSMSGQGMGGQGAGGYGQAQGMVPSFQGQQPSAFQAAGTKPQAGMGSFNMGGQTMSDATQQGGMYMGVSQFGPGQPQAGAGQHSPAWGGRQH